MNFLSHNIVRFLALPVMLALVAVTSHIAEAASLSSVSDVQSSLKISTASSHKVSFTTPTGITINKTVILTYPQSAPNYNFAGKTFSDVTITWGPSTGLENSTTTAAAAAANVWGVAFSGVGSSIVTLTSPTSGAAITAGSKVIVTLNSSNAINPGTANTYQMGITGTFGDVGTTTTQILNDDQVLVSGVVNQTLTFSLSGNAVGFGTLAPGVSRYANTSGGSGTDVVAHTIAVATNAASGYALTATGTTLTTAGGTIAAIGGTSAVANTSVEQFGINATAAGGSGTVSSPFATASQFAFTPGSLQTLATAAGPSNSTTYSVHYLANAIATTKAGSYSATITYTATANY